MEHALHFFFVEVRHAAVAQRELQTNAVLGELGLELVGELFEEGVKVDPPDEDAPLAFGEGQGLAHHRLE